MGLSRPLPRCFLRGALVPQRFCQSAADLSRAACLILKASHASESRAAAEVTAQRATLDYMKLSKLGECIAAAVGVDAKPGTGHSRSPLKHHERWLLDLVARRPDLTLHEIRARLRCERKVKIGITAIWRFYERHKITFKKNSPRHRAGPS